MHIIISLIVLGFIISVSLWLAQLIFTVGLAIVWAVISGVIAGCRKLFGKDDWTS